MAPDPLQRHHETLGGETVLFLVQQLAVGAALLPWTATTPWLWNGLLWLAVALSLASGVQYLWRARLLRDAAARTSAERIS